MNNYVGGVIIGGKGYGMSSFHQKVMAKLYLKMIMENKALDDGDIKTWIKYLKQ